MVSFGAGALMGAGMVPFGGAGRRSGESARLPPMCPGFDSWTRRHMGLSLLLVLVLAQVRGFFSGFSSFSSS